MEYTGNKKRRKIMPGTLMDRRVTRSLKSTRINFVEHLPTELTQLIFSLLNADELGTCLAVSKTWRSAVNSNTLWKKCCLENGLKVDEDKKFERNTKTDLCIWSQIWLNFRTSSAYTWFTRSYKKTFKIDKGPGEERIVCDDESVVLWRGLRLTLWKTSNIDEPKCSFNLPFTPDGSWCLQLDSKIRAVAVSKSNIVLIYKYGDNGFKCFKAIAVTKGKKILQAQKSFRRTVRVEIKPNRFLALNDEVFLYTRFVATNINKQRPCLAILIFQNGSIWIQEENSPKRYVVNILNKNVIEKEPLPYIFIHESFIANWSNSKISVDTSDGHNALTITRKVKIARVNNHILVICCVTVVERKSNYLMETWDLYTKERLRCTQTFKNTRFQLHPSRDILYIFREDQKDIKALCPITGDELWHVEVPNIPNFTEWYTDVICQRYLIVFQHKCATPGNKKVMHVYDAESGQYLYETERPPGHVNYVSGNVIMALTSTYVYIWSFLQQ